MDGDVSRIDLNTLTSLGAVIRKLLPASDASITLSSTGADVGTGDVTLIAAKATSSQLGMMKVGAGLSVDVNGIVSANITSAVPTSRTLTINGTTFDLSADRSWTVGGTSQWTTTGSNIYFTGGFVGINQTSPLYALDVSGGARFTAWSSMGINARFAWNAISDQYLANGYAGNIVLDNTAGRFIFSTAPSGVAGAFPTFTERMTILNDGRVGINTSSPYSYVKLHVANGFRANADSATSTGVIEIYRSGSSNNVYIDGNFLTLYNQSSNDSITMNAFGIVISGLPTSSAGLGSGYLWQDGSGYLRIVP